MSVFYSISFLVARARQFVARWWSGYILLPTSAARFTAVLIIFQMNVKKYINISKIWQLIKYSYFLLLLIKEISSVRSVNSEQKLL